MGEFFVALGGVAAFCTAGMNVYTYFTTGKQIDRLIQTVQSQAQTVASANERLADGLSRTHDLLNKLIDRLS